MECLLCHCSRYCCCCKCPVRYATPIIVCCRPASAQLTWLWPMLWLDAGCRGADSQHTHQKHDSRPQGHVHLRRRSRPHAAQAQPQHRLCNRSRGGKWIHLDMSCNAADPLQPCRDAVHECCTAGDAWQSPSACTSAACCNACIHWCCCKSTHITPLSSSQPCACQPTATHQSNVPWVHQPRPPASLSSCLQHPRVGVAVQGLLHTCSPLLPLLVDGGVRAVQLGRCGNPRGVAVPPDNAHWVQRCAQRGTAGALQLPLVRLVGRHLLGY